MVGFQKSEEILHNTELPNFHDIHVEKYYIWVQYNWQAWHLWPSALHTKQINLNMVQLILYKDFPHSLLF
jgi:hypothetical protein